MYMSTHAPIDQVGAFTAFGGDLTHVIVGDMISDEYFENINTKNIDVFRQICREHKQDLDKLAKTYENFDIVVDRPKILYNKPSLEKHGNITIFNPVPPKNPHDHVLCIDNVFVNTFSYIEKFSEQKSIEHVTDRLGATVDYKPVPIPEEWDNNFYTQMHDEDWPGNRDILCDGAQFYPCGKHILYTKRYSNSQKGIDFIKQAFADVDVEFVELQLPIKNHMDGQFRILRPGHVLSVWPKEVLQQQIPQFANWTITVDDSWKIAKQKRKDQKFISDWIDTDIESSSLNIGFVHVNENTVIISDEHPTLCKSLEKAQVNWVVSPIRHKMFWNSSISCATATIHRKDTNHDYLN